MLVAITGYDAVSLQPNAGSQGELAGLLAIRAYHRSRGDDQRDGLPHPVVGPRHQRGQRGDGRHATWSWSPATSAATSTSTTCGPRPTTHGRRLAAAMVTYPSTHGVFEAGIGEHLRDRPRPRRPGVRRRRQPQRARRAGPARPIRRRRQPPQPAQDVLHPPRRRRSRRRPGGGPRPPRAVPARPPAARRGGRRRPGPVVGGALGLGRHPAHLVGLHHADGRATACAAATAAAILNANYMARRLDAALPRALHGRRTAWSPTSASSTCARSPRPPA